MKKGCLAAIAIFFGICVLLGMCSTDTDAENAGTTQGTNVETSLIEASTTETESPHEHSYMDATCLIPKTCSICGFTEGGTLEHTWNDPTCSIPKTCSVCGTTEGDTLEHNWLDATCTKKKTCSVCEETTGELAPHTYSNGKCKVCKDLDPTDPRNITVWIPRNGGKKYHSYSGCSNMKNPKKTTQAKAEKSGFDACARCH